MGKNYYLGQLDEEREDYWQWLPSVSFEFESFSHLVLCFLETRRLADSALSHPNLSWGCFKVGCRCTLLGQGLGHVNQEKDSLASFFFSNLGHMEGRKKSLKAFAFV